MPQMVRGVVSVGSAKTEGLLYACLVTARTGSRNNRDAFRRLLRELGCECDVVQTFDWGHAYEVFGSPSALAELTSGYHPLVESWEYLMPGGRMVNTGQGTPRTRA